MHVCMYGQLLDCGAVAQLLKADILREILVIQRIRDESARSTEYLGYARHIGHLGENGVFYRLEILRISRDDAYLVISAVGSPAD